MNQKLNRKKTIFITLAVVAVLAVTAFVVVQTTDLRDHFSKKQEPAYIAADGLTATAFLTSQDGSKGQSIQITRGTKVFLEGQPQDAQTTVDIIYKDQPCTIPLENISKDKRHLVLEKTAYVRTPATLYAKASGPEIQGFAKKGSKLSICGYDTVNSDGSVCKYRVSTGDDSYGWIYSKYTAKSQDEAEKYYNEHGEYDIAKKARYSFDLGGGKAEELDYYPVDKPEIEGNPFCSKARAMYLHAGAALKDKYFELAVKSGANAVVMNIDGGDLAYESPVAAQMSPRAFKSAYTSIEEYQKAVKRYNDAGIYTIGRIACFNDEHFAEDHPEACIEYGGKGTKWLSAYSRQAWEYKVAMALEAVDLMGFKEIQFDYVRFPESTYEMSRSGNVDFGNRYEESKAQAIQNFCFYAADQIHDAGAYFSVDVFGESSNGYVTAYGQYWPAISNVADAISSMPYTDHYGQSDTWSDPYTTMYNWAKAAAARQKEIPSPAAARTWITGYNTPSWAPSVDYDYSRLKDQVEALEDAGLDGGFIPWNSKCDFDKYQEYQGIWGQ